jgi:hypothetical protein
MAESKIVKVKLKARGLVNGVIEEAGTIVELPELADDGLPLAACFGEIQKDAPAPAANAPKPE